MQPFDLTQAAYAVEAVLPAVRMLDETGQELVVMMGPGAVRTRADAARFHVAVSNLPAAVDILARLAVYSDEVLTLLQHLEDGEDVRLVVTAKSRVVITAFDRADDDALPVREVA